MADFEFVRKVIEILEESQVDELEVEMGQMRVRVKKTGSQPYPAMIPAPLAISAPASAPASAGGGAAEESGVQYIKSPMVGTFYRAPAPDAPAYVQSGDVVDEDTVVCIIEAMKVMNEIKAEVSGVIDRLLVENAQPVEFGQPLFKVRAS